MRIYFYFFRILSMNNEKVNEKVNEKKNYRMDVDKNE